MVFINFILFSLLLFSSLFVFFSVNPLHSLFFFMCVYCISSLILILYGLDFFGLIILNVYIGAIAVLFLFIVMMINFKKIEMDNSTFLMVGIFIIFFFFIEFFYFFFFNYITYIPYNLLYNFNSFFFVELNCLDINNKYFLLKKIGFFFFEKNPFLLILISIILLIALFSSIFLTNYKKGYSNRRQYGQLFRNNHLFRLFFY